MEKKITGYTTVDISQWHRKEHFEAFQSVAQCTYNQTVQLDITAFLKTVKKNKHKFYPAFIHILARLMNAHPEFRMAMKDGELVIWDSVHPCYTVFHEQTETFSSLWSEYHDDFRQFLHIYSQDVACYGENLAYFPKGFIENMFFVSANPWVSFTSFDLNVANMDNFFAPVFTMGKYYTQGDKVLMPLAIQVHHAVCDGFHVGRMLNELQQYCDEWQGSRPKTKLGITKYSIVTNSNDSVTLRLMTEHDLAMLYEWLNRSHIVEWWGGEEARPTLADVQEQYLPSVLAQESVTPYIAMLNGEPIGYAQSYVALGSGDGWWEEETDPGVRGIDLSLANASQLGKGLGTKLVRALVELLFNDPEVTKIQTDPSPSNLRAIRCYEKAGFERQGTVTTPDGPAVYMVQTRQAFERTRSVA